MKLFLTFLRKRHKALRTDGPTDRRTDGMKLLCRYVLFSGKWVGQNIRLGAKHHMGTIGVLRGGGGAKNGQILCRNSLTMGENGKNEPNLQM